MYIFLPSIPFIHAHIHTDTPGRMASFGSPAPMSAPPQEDTEYEVVGVVRQKLLFKERPKPIVSRYLLRY